MTHLPWEDHLLERKVESDLKDLLRTMVSFANSVRPGHVATILIGEQDDGSAQGVTNPDSIQKKVRKIADKIYPPIVWRSQVYEKDGVACVRVEIEPSGETPHFGGAAWVREGSVTRRATDEVFQQLIDLRSSKVYELAQHLGDKISIIPDTGATDKIFSPDASMEVHPRWMLETDVTLLSVNQYWATFEKSGQRASEPPGKLFLAWDHKNDQLAVLVAV